MKKIDTDKVIHNLTNAPLYWTEFDGETFFILINRGYGKITTTSTTEYKVEGNISTNDEVFGKVTIGVAEDQLTVTRLIDIELIRGKKKQGTGTKAVTLLANCTADGMLIINDIQNKAKPFWNKLGVEYFDDEGRKDMVSARLYVEGADKPKPIKLKGFRDEDQHE